MNNIPKYVASKTLRRTEWQNSRLLEGDMAEAVAKVKAEAGKDIYILGSSDLCQTLMKHQLIDEYFLMIHPMALGKGKRLFQPTGPQQNLELLKSMISKDGVLVLTYRVKKEATPSQ
jgi:dihydrofolate reductase